MKLRIKATTFAPWQRSTDVHAKQLSATAFNDWMRSLAAYRLPIKVCHRTPVPVAGDRNWLQTDTGLQCTCEIDTSSELGLAEALAVRHRHLTGASMSFLPEYCRTVKVRDRFLEVIDVAHPVELSLTSTPMLSGTSIEIIGERRKPIAGLPDNKYHAELLSAFLEMIGLPVPPMRTFTSLPAPAPKPVQQPTPKPVKASDECKIGVWDAAGKFKWIPESEYQRQQQQSRNGTQQQVKPSSAAPIVGRRRLMGWF